MSNLRADCPLCDDPGYVTARTNGPDEAECLTSKCDIVIFEVKRD